jgi:hypothetical protein
LPKAAWTEGRLETDPPLLASSQRPAMRAHDQPLTNACARSNSHPPPIAARPSHDSPARQSAGLKIDWWQGSAGGRADQWPRPSQTPLGQQRPRAQGVSALRHFNLPLSLPDLVSHPNPSRLLAHPPVETARDTFPSHLTYLKLSLADFSFALRFNSCCSTLAGPSPHFPLAFPWYL